MKQLLVLLMLCIAAATSAQTRIINNNSGKETNTYVVVYDFAKKVYDTNFVHPRVHHPVVFKVKNINRLAYDVVITSKDSVLAVSDFPSGMEFKNPLKDTVALEGGEDPTKLPALSIPELNPSDTNKTGGNTISLLDSARMKSDLKSELNTYNAKLATQKAEIAKLEKDSLAIINEIQNLAARPNIDSAQNQIRLDSIAKLQQVQQPFIQRLKILRVDTVGSGAEIDAITRRINAIGINEAAIRAYERKFTGLNQSYQSIVREYQKMWQLFSSYNQLYAIASDPFYRTKKRLHALKIPLTKYLLLKE